jgi:hypothetical protein
MVSMLSLFGLNGIETWSIFVEYSKTFFICYLIIHHFVLVMVASHCVCACVRVRRVEKHMPYHVV